MPIKSWMSVIMGQIESEHPDLFALEFGKIAESDFVYTLASTNIDQSAPNLATIHMHMRARMSSIMGQIEPEHPELFALEFGKIAESDFVYTLASTNIDQSVPNLARIHMHMRARMRKIMGQIEPEHPELFALEFGKIAESDFVYTLASTNIHQSALNLVKMYVTIRSWISANVDQLVPNMVLMYVVRS